MKTTSPLTSLPTRVFVVCLLLSSGMFVSCSLLADDKSNADPQPLQAVFVANDTKRWKVADGRLEYTSCDVKSSMSKVTLLAHRLKSGPGHFTMSVRAGIDVKHQASKDAAIGWMLGDGLFAGVDGAGRAFVRDANKPNADRGIQIGAATEGIAPHEVLKDVAIRILASTDTVDEKLFVVRISIHDPETNRLFSATTRTVPTAQLANNISLVSHTGSTGKEMRVRFHQWDAIGSKLNQSLRATDVPTIVTKFDNLRVSESTAYRSTSAVLFELKSLPKSNKFEMPRINNPITRVYFADEPNVDLKFIPETTTWVTYLSKRDPSKTRVIVIGTVGEPLLHDPKITMRANSDGTYVLPAHMAVTHGEKLRYEPQPHKNTVGYWTVPEDFVHWNLDVKQPGRYSLRILQGCGTGQGGSKVGVFIRPFASVNNDTPPESKPALSFKVQDTGHFQNFVPRELGEIELAEPGRFRLELRPLHLAKKAVMDVREMRLVPVIR